MVSEEIQEKLAFEKAEALKAIANLEVYLDEKADIDREKVLVAAFDEFAKTAVEEVPATVRTQGEAAKRAMSAFEAFDERVEATVEQFHFQLTRQPRQGGQMVKSVARFQLFQKPQSLLGIIGHTAHLDGRPTTAFLVGGEQARPGVPGCLHEKPGSGSDRRARSDGDLVDCRVVPQGTI